MKKLVLSLMLTISMVVSFTACKTQKLETGGAYAPIAADGTQIIAPDMGLYAADSAFKLTHTAVNIVFEFERDNRALLKSISPDIKQTLDDLRPQAVVCWQAYAKARRAYLENPTPAGLDRLQSILSKMNQVLNAANAVIPKENP